MINGILPCVRVEDQFKLQTMTVEQAKLCIQYWARQLKLEHWVIDVQYRGFDVMQEDSGRCVATYSLLRASIQLLEPRDYRDEEVPVNMEQIIIHELLHLTFSAWLEWSDEAVIPMRGMVRDTCLELPIETLAWTLFNTRKSGATEAMPWEIKS